MGYEAREERDEPMRNREVPERNDDEEMPDAPEQEEKDEDDMVYCMGKGERLLNSLTV